MLQLLEAMVERPPPRAILDDFGLDHVLPPEPLSPLKVEVSQLAPRPYSLQRTSPSISITTKVAGFIAPTDSAVTISSPAFSPSALSPTARPYIPRKKSPSGSPELC